MIIGITGRIGSGKSTVAKLFAKGGAEIVDADQIAHLAYGKDTPTYHSIIALFGDSICDSKGEIIRPRVRQYVYENNSLLESLEKIIHPFVIEQILKIIQTNDKRWIVLDVPLLFESHLDLYCDYTIWVDANDSVREERLWNRSKLSLKEADALQTHLIDPEIKKNKSSFLINNSSDLATLETQVNQLIKRLIN